jgi:hypothetical protein
MLQQPPPHLQFSSVNGSMHTSSPKVPSRKQKRSTKKIRKRKKQRSKAILRPASSCRKPMQLRDLRRLARGGRLPANDDDAYYSVDPLYERLVSLYTSPPTKPPTPKTPPRNAKQHAVAPAIRMPKVVRNISKTKASSRKTPPRRAKQTKPKQINSRKGKRTKSRPVKTQAQGTRKMIPRKAKQQPLAKRSGQSDTTNNGTVGANDQLSYKNGRNGKNE